MTRKNSLTTLLVVFLLCLAIPIGLYSFVSLPFSPPAAGSPQGKLPPIPDLPAPQETAVPVVTASPSSTADPGEKIQSAENIIADFRARHAAPNEKQSADDTPQESSKSLAEIVGAVLDRTESVETLIALLGAQDAAVRRSACKAFGDAGAARYDNKAGRHVALERILKSLTKDQTSILVTSAIETIVHDTQDGNWDFESSFFLPYIEGNGALPALPCVIWAADNHSLPLMRSRMTNLACNIDPKSPEVDALLARRRTDPDASVRLHALQTSGEQLVRQYLGQQQKRGPPYNLSIFASGLSR